MRITNPLWIIAFACLCACGCNAKSTAETAPAQVHPEAAQPETAQPKAAQPEAAQAEAAQPEAAQAPIVHDPMNPPVDCPLRKAGIDPTHMKPFEQIESYIAFLERPDRMIWQKPKEVVESLELKGNERIMDIGAGSGYFSFPLSEKVPQGRVFAADVEPEMIRHIHHNAMLKGIQNIEIRHIDAAKPEVPENIDLVFICDVLHHIANPIEWMKGVVSQLPTGARMAIIEFHEGDIPQGPPASLKISKARIIEIATSAGLTLHQENAELLPYQSIYIFKK